MKLPVLLVPALLVMVAGCAAKDKEATGSKIDLYDDYFGQTSKTIAKGTELEFENEGHKDHTVTIHLPPAAATEFVLDKTLKPGDEAEYTFSQAGTYHVFCKFHGSIGGGMHADITVTA